MKSKKEIKGYKGAYQWELESANAQLGIDGEKCGKRNGKFTIRIEVQEQNSQYI